MVRGRFIAALATIAVCTSTLSGQSADTAYWKRRAPRIGDPAPPLTIDTIYDHPDAPVAKYAAGWEAFEGRVVVLEFSTSWCGPCRKLIPHMNDLVKAMKDEPVTFISVSNENEQAIAAFRKEAPTTTWFARDADGSTFEDYWVNGLPYAAVIDRHGRIAALTYPSEITPAALGDLIHDRPIGLPVMNATPFRQDWDVRPASEKGPAATIAESVGASIVELDKATGRMRQDPKTGRLELAGPPMMLVSRTFDVPQKLIVDERGLAANRYWQAVAVPPDGKLDTARKMLRQLIETRFDFTAVREKKLRPVRLLRRLPGAPPLTPATPGGRAGRASLGTYDNATTLRGLAEWLTAIQPVPVVDDTGLEGVFDIKFSWESSEDAALFAGLAKAGLTLVDGEAPVESLVLKRTGGEATPAVPTCQGESAGVPASECRSAKVPERANRRTLALWHSGTLTLGPYAPGTLNF